MNYVQYAMNCCVTKIFYCHLFIPLRKYHPPLKRRKMCVDLCIAVYLKQKENTFERKTFSYNFLTVTQIQCSTFKMS